MKRFGVRMAVVTATVAAVGAIAPQAAQANHACALDKIPLLDNICEGYHEPPKQLLQYIAYCLLTDPDHCL